MFKTCKKADIPTLMRRLRCAVVLYLAAQLLLQAFILPHRLVLGLEFICGGACGLGLVFIVRALWLRFSASGTEK